MIEEYFKKEGYVEYNLQGEIVWAKRGSIGPGNELISTPDLTFKLLPEILKLHEIEQLMYGVRVL